MLAAGTAEIETENSHSMKLAIYTPTGQVVIRAV